MTYSVSGVLSFLPMYYDSSVAWVWQDKRFGKAAWNNYYPEDDSGFLKHADATYTEFENSGHLKPYVPQIHQIAIGLRIPMFVRVFAKEKNKEFLERITQIELGSGADRNNNGIALTANKKAKYDNRAMLWCIEFKGDDLKHNVAGGFKDYILNEFCDVDQDDFVNQHNSMRVKIEYSARK